MLIFVVELALLATLCVGEEFRVDEGDPSASVSINYQDGRYEVRRENTINIGLDKIITESPS